MPITTLERKAWNLEFYQVTTAELETEQWNTRYFQRNALVLEVDDDGAGIQLRRGPGIWEDMKVVLAPGEGVDLPIAQSDVTGLEATLGPLVASTYIIDTGSLDTDVDPGSNTLRINHADLSSATFMSISDIDGKSVDQGSLRSMLGGVLTGRSLSNGATFAVRINAASRPGAFTRYAISHLRGTWPTDGTVVMLQWIPDIQEPELWIDGEHIYDPVDLVITGTTNASGQAIEDLTNTSPALSSATLINAYLRVGSGSWFAARITDDTLGSFTIDFLDSSEDTAPEGTPYTLIFKGQKA